MSLWSACYEVFVDLDPEAERLMYITTRVLAATFHVFILGGIILIGPLFGFFGMRQIVLAAVGILILAWTMLSWIATALPPHAHRTVSLADVTP
jgi:uncharacterized membrane protein